MLCISVPVFSPLSTPRIRYYQEPVRITLRPFTGADTGSKGGINMSARKSRRNCGCGCGSAAKESIEEFTEDMPMHRYTHPIPICECGCGSGAGSCECREELEQLLAAVSCQNQLLVDLLAAVNSLTAALLTCRPA